MERPARNGAVYDERLASPINENEVLDWLGGQFLGVPVPR